MDQLEEIIKKSTELGEAIAQTTVYRDFKKAEHDLLHNTEARKFVAKGEARISWETNGGIGIE